MVRTRATMARGRATARGRGRARGHRAAPARGRAPVVGQRQERSPSSEPEYQSDKGQAAGDGVAPARTQPEVTSDPTIHYTMAKILCHLDAQQEAAGVMTSGRGSQTRVRAQNPEPGPNRAAHPAAAMAPRIDATPTPGDDIRPMEGAVMTTSDQDLVGRFRKLEPPRFLGTSSEDAYEFILDMHKLLHRMGIVENYGVDYVSYQFCGNAKTWWRYFVACIPESSPPLTWTQFCRAFLEKYMPQSLKEACREEFLHLEQRGMSMEAYVTRYLYLAHYSIPLIPTEPDRIRRFVSGLVDPLQIPSLQMEAIGASFQSIVEHASLVEAAKARAFGGGSEKRQRQIRRYGGSSSRRDGQSSRSYQPYTGNPVQSALQALSSRPSRQGIPKRSHL
ncbi:uncharacterized protein LOC132606438 [Lycium barbarum]|uniref:uncharacterized protein LOC132606438 n=1 Tax=Lycium barbarum TaxID=112863 RepID=UPI00293EA2DC|nr:uncharacterized protein LOC132606438 [Lycium barbarum]